MSIYYQKINESIYLETPGNNQAAAEFVKTLGFEPFLSMHKMYRGPEPKHDIDQMFCYSSLVTGG